MDCEDTRVDNGAEGNFDAFIYGLCAQDASCTDLIVELPSLVENERQNVIVIRNSDD